MTGEEVGVLRRESIRSGLFNLGVLRFSLNFGRFYRS